MLKKLGSAKATPFKIAIAKHMSDTPRVDDGGRCCSTFVSEKMIALSSELADEVNHDVCVTNAQMRRILLSLRSIAVELLENPNNGTALLPLSTYINSIRLECQHCLNNSSCHQRPDSA